MAETCSYIPSVERNKDLSQSYCREESWSLTQDYRQKAFEEHGIKGMLPDEETAQKVGNTIIEEVLVVDKGESHSIKNVSLIDMEIANILFLADEELHKVHPNWKTLETLILMLTVYLQRKGGREEQELSQLELDMVKAEVMEVLKTHNDYWTLAMNIACGTITLVAGLVAGGAAVSAIGQLAGGAVKVAGIVKAAGDLANGGSMISQGANQSIGKYLETRVEFKRTFHNYLMQRARDNKDTARQGETTYRQGMAAAHSTIDRVNQAFHEAIRAIFAGV